MPTILAGALKRMPGLPANVVAGVPRVEKDPRGGDVCISSSRCFVFSHVFFSGLGSCMHFPYFSGCAEVFLPNMRASLTRRLWPVNSRSRPWCTMRSMIAAASLSSAKTVPHLLNSMFVVNMMIVALCGVGGQSVAPHWGAWIEITRRLSRRLPSSRTPLGCVD